MATDTNKHALEEAIRQLERKHNYGLSEFLSLNSTEIWMNYFEMGKILLCYARLNVS